MRCRFHIQFATDGPDCGATVVTDGGAANGERRRNPVFERPLQPIKGKHPTARISKKNAYAFGCSKIRCRFNPNSRAPRNYECAEQQKKNGCWQDHEKSPDAEDAWSISIFAAQKWTTLLPNASTRSVNLPISEAGETTREMPNGSWTVAGCRFSSRICDWVISAMGTVATPLA